MTGIPTFWRWEAACAWPFALFIALFSLGLGAVMTIAGVLASLPMLLGGLMWLGIGLATARRLLVVRPVTALSVSPAGLSFRSLGRSVSLRADEIELIHPVNDNPFLPIGGHVYGGVHGLMIRARARTRLGSTTFVTIVPNRDAVLMKADASGFNVDDGESLV